MASIFDIVRDVPGALADTTAFARPGGLARLIMDEEARRTNPMLQTLGGQFGRRAQLATGGALGLAGAAGGAAALGPATAAGLAGAGSFAAPAASRIPGASRLISGAGRLGRGLVGRGNIQRAQLAAGRTPRNLTAGQLGKLTRQGTGQLPASARITRASLSGGQRARLGGRAAAGVAGRAAAGGAGVGAVRGLIDRGEDDFPRSTRETRGREGLLRDTGGGAGRAQQAAGQQQRGVEPLPAIPGFDPVEPIPTPEGAFANIESGFESAIADLERREQLGQELLGQLPGRIGEEFGQAEEAVAGHQADVLGQFDQAAVDPSLFMAEGGFSPIQETLQAGQAARQADVPLLEAGFQQLLGGARTGLEQARAEALTQEQQRLDELGFQSQLAAQEANIALMRDQAEMQQRRQEFNRQLQEGERQRQHELELQGLDEQSVQEQAQDAFPPGFVTPERVPFMTEEGINHVVQDAPEEVVQGIEQGVLAARDAALEAGEDPFLGAYLWAVQNGGNRPLLTSIILNKHFGPVPVQFGG